jgi:aminoglycoside phosphotransferase (APT) family kinase protein
LAATAAEGAGHLAAAAALSTDDVARALDEVRLSARIRSLAPGPKSYSNRLWLADSDEGTLLVRVPGRDADPEHLRATVEASRLATEAGIPAPRFCAFAAHTTIGLPLVVQEYRRGEQASEALRRGGIALGVLAGRLGDWIGRLHAIRRDTFGPVVDSKDGSSTWAEHVRQEVTAALADLHADQLPQSRRRIESEFDSALADLAPPGPASLIHGDLYFDNVLVDQGAAVALLDFEHARFADRFAEFGKLDELIFDWWPGSEAPFTEAYTAHFPSDDSDAVRRRIGLGLYALRQLAYFQRWQPELTSTYRERLDRWLSHR